MDFSIGVKSAAMPPSANTIRPVKILGRANHTIRNIKLAIGLSIESNALLIADDIIVNTKRSGRRMGDGGQRPIGTVKVRVRRAAVRGRQAAAEAIQLRNGKPSVTHLITAAFVVAPMAH